MLHFYLLALWFIGVDKYERNEVITLDIEEDQVDVHLKGNVVVIDEIFGDEEAFLIIRTGTKYGIEKKYAITN